MKAPGRHRPRPRARRSSPRLRQQQETTRSTATTASAADCTPGQARTQSKGELTVATDKPAYPPYFEDDEPTNGEGLRERRRLRDRQAARLLARPKSKWTVEPFNSSYAPGPKDFDFDVNEISITPAREKAVDFSAPYYTANQAVVALKGSDAAEGQIARRPEGREASASRSGPPASKRSKT